MPDSSTQPTEQCALLGYTATDKVYIRFIAPRHTPISYLESKGLTYLDKDTNEPRFVAINGYIDLATGEFYRQYGKKYPSAYLFVESCYLMRIEICDFFRLLILNFNYFILLVACWRDNLNDITYFFAQHGAC